MNLMNLKTKQWVKEILDIAAPNLEQKLGNLIPAHTVAGKISSYFVKRYNFNPDCNIIAFSGDNPCSLAGLLMKQGDIGLSLGTSDTLFGPLLHPNPALEGHIFCDPVRPDGYMALLCYKNGSLTREHIRNLYASKDWTQFDQILEKTKPGNDGNIGFYFKEMEITPKANIGTTRFDSNGQKIEEFPNTDIDVRAIIEGQFLSMFVHCTSLGMKPREILATGGASLNKHILQIISNVFGVPVFTFSQPNSACFGAALRAYHGWISRDGLVPYEDVISKSVSILRKEAEPDTNSHQIYVKMAERYRELEKNFISIMEEKL